MHLTRVTLLADQFPTEEGYPFSLPVFQETNGITFHSPVTFFIGENGTGKSTLLEALAHKCGIHIWRGMERKRFEVNPYEEALQRFIAVEWSDGVVPGSFVFTGFPLKTEKICKIVKKFSCIVFLSMLYYCPLPYKR